MFHFMYIFLVALPFSISLEICGTANIRQCETPTQINCVEKLLEGLAEWFDSYEATGYFVPPFDPLLIDELEFENGKGLIVTLKDVIVNGLNDITVDIESVIEFQQYYRYQNSLKYSTLELTVGSYEVSNQDSCVIFQTDKDLGISVADLSINSFVFLYNVKRCTGVNYLNVTNDSESTTGRIEFSRGPLQLDEAGEASLANALGEKIGAEFTLRVNSIYNKEPSKVFFKSINIQVTDPLSSNLASHTHYI